MTERHRELILTWGFKRVHAGGTRWSRFPLWRVKRDLPYRFGFAVLARWELELLTGWSPVRKRSSMERES